MRDLLAYRAQQQPREATMAARARDEQVGALGGIAELARSALSDQAAAAPRRASVPTNQS